MPEISEKELAAASKQLWLKALTAVQISNHTYAISLLQGILGDNPGFLEARKLLRKCELQLAGGAKKKSGLFGLQTGGMGLMKIQGVAKKEPLAALPLIEKELEKDPFNEAANDLLFDVCLKLELSDSAAFALETVRSGAPENAKLMKKLAAFYTSREMYDSESSPTSARSEKSFSPMVYQSCRESGVGRRESISERSSRRRPPVRHR